MSYMKTPSSPDARSMTLEEYVRTLKYMRRIEKIVRVQLRRILKLLDKQYKSIIKPSDANMCLYLSLYLAADYYTGAKSALNARQLVSSYALLRCSLETLINMEYIFLHTTSDQKRKKLQREFVASSTNFSKLYEKFRKDFKTAEKNTLQFDVLNRWTRDSISKRVRKSSWGNRLLYNNANYAIHANPAQANLIGSKRFLNDLILSRINNISVMLDILDFASKHLSFPIFDEINNSDITRARSMMINMFQSYILKIPVYELIEKSQKFQSALNKIWPRRRSMSR